MDHILLMAHPTCMDQPLRMDRLHMDHLTCMDQLILMDQHQLLQIFMNQRILIDQLQILLMNQRQLLCLPGGLGVSGDHATELRLTGMTSVHTPVVRSEPGSVMAVSAVLGRTGRNGCVLTSTGSPAFPSAQIRFTSTAESSLPVAGGLL